MRKVGALGAVVVILALVMLVTSLTASIVTTPKYGPTPEDLPSHAGYTDAYYVRATEDELREHRGETGPKCVYCEVGRIYGEKAQVSGSLYIFEFTSDSEAKREYELRYEKVDLDLSPSPIDIGDEGVSFSRDGVVVGILFRTGKFVVISEADPSEDIARITEQNIKRATAPVTSTPRPTPTPTTSVPSFEAVFAIVGVLFVAYLVLRRRR
ncbi:MAG: hypothetical protein U9O85_11675 [Euryarchaeota archaeon]|nr:hypothetical protein [Euryarchaeota archaeon]